MARAAQVEHRGPVRPGRPPELHGVEADGDHEIGPVEDRLRGRAAAEDAEGEGMGLGDRPLALQGRQHGRRKRLGERTHPAAVVGPAAEPGDDDRPARRLDQGGRRVKRRDIGRGGGTPADRRRARDGEPLGGGAGQGEVHGAARLRHRELGGAGDPARGGVGGDAETLLGEGVALHRRRPGRLGQEDHRRPIEPRVREAGEGRRRRLDGGRAGALAELAAHGGHDAGGER